MGPNNAERPHRRGGSTFNPDLPLLRDPNSHWLEDGPRPGHVSWVWRAITRFAPLVDSLVDRPSPERTSRQVDPDGLQFLSATRLVPD